MNKTIIIVAVVIGALLLAVPVLSQLKKSGGGEGGAAPSEPAKPEPYWDELTLPGTSWRVKIEDKIQVQVDVYSGGEAVATHPLLTQLVGQESVPGQWWVEGDKLHVSTTLNDKTFDATLDIVGKKLLSNGQEIERLK